MRKARFWFRVRGERRHVDFHVEPGDSADFVARWALTLLNEPRRDLVLIVGRWMIPA